MSRAAHVLQWRLQRDANSREGANPKKHASVQIEGCNSRNSTSGAKDHLAGDDCLILAISSRLDLQGWLLVAVLSGKVCRLARRLIFQRDGRRSNATIWR